MNLKTKNSDISMRNWSIDDIDAYARYANNYNIWKYFRDEFPYPFTYKNAEDFINNVGTKNVKTHFAILYKNECVGDIHISIPNDIRRLNGLLGYWVAEPYWGKGIITECINTITEYGFIDLNLVRVYAKVFANNTASIKALEKSGFVREGYFKKAIIKEDKILDQVLYAKINTEDY